MFELKVLELCHLSRVLWLEKTQYFQLAIQVNQMMKMGNRYRLQTIPERSLT